MTDADDQGYEAEEDQQVSEQIDVSELQKKLAKLEQDNYKLREERRRAEFESKYGAEIAAKVSKLPEDMREEWAEELAKLQTPQASPEVNEPAPEETPNVEVPAGLAAVAEAPATGAPDARTLSLDDFNKFVETEGLVAAAAKYGQMVRFPDVDNPLATGQAPSIQGQFRPPS